MLGFLLLLSVGEHLRAPTNSCDDARLSSFSQVEETRPSDFRQYNSRRGCVFPLSFLIEISRIVIYRRARRNEISFGFSSDTSLLAHLSQGVADGSLQNTRAFSSQIAVDLFETTDEIENLVTCDHSARRSAKMCAAAERAIVVDQTIAGGGVEHGTGAVEILRK